MSPNPSPEQLAPLRRGSAKPDWAKTAREIRRETQGPWSRRPIWQWGIVAVLAFAVIGVYAMPSAPPAAPAAPAENEVRGSFIHPLDVTTVTAQTLREVLPVSGTLRPNVQIEIASRISGTVERVEARLGDHVDRGSLLLSIESDGLQAQLHQQQATLAAHRAQSALAQAQAERSQELNDRGLSANANLETSRSNLAVHAANVEMQQAAVTAAEIALRDTQVMAPFEGVVSARKAEPGQTVASGTVLFELVDLSSMRATIDVPVARTVRLQPGQTVHLSVQGLEGQFVGQIEGVAPVTRSESRISEVTVSVANPDGRLRGGMYANGEVELASIPDAIALPRSSLREDADGTHVLKVGDGKLERQAVQVGASVSGGDLVIVTSGLAERDRVVSGRLAGLRAGTEIHIEEPS